MRRRDFIAGAIAAGGLSMLPGCDNATKPQIEKSKGRQRVAVAQWGQERYLIYLPFYIGQEAGFFDREGLDIDLSFSGNDDQVFAAVARGDVQFGIGDPIFAAISRNRGGDGVVVGQLVERAALWGVARKGSKPRRAPADFAGARIGTFPRPSTTYTLLREMIDRNKVPGAAILEVPIGSELALLESGAADVVMMLEPAASLAEAKGYSIVSSFPDLWGPFAFTGLTGSGDYVRQNAQVVASVRNAMQSALNLAHSEPRRAIAIGTRLFPQLDSGVVATAVGRMLKDQTVPTRFAVNPQGWIAAVRVRTAMGELQPGRYDNVIA